MKLLRDQIVIFLDKLWEDKYIHYLKAYELTELVDKLEKIIKPYERDV